ncbi:ADP-ribose 1''-phosphate phosphatase [Penicillium brasilianum]|uniref:ADP-ribose 1''-phosphate phosphatase n=1 Tax=Penicillium brasilianum TaxID=104259 RepID=A0A1S9RN50_PENBI|nr:ADP-ribose 1''-phosphate phosphatase [Penicillium brasilianum]
MQAPTFRPVSVQVAEPNPHHPTPTWITELPGNLFDAPEGSALIHACNTQGSWGGGIARAFKERYPAAYQVYRSHCLQFLRARKPHEISDMYTHVNSASILPLGTALIIPPQPADSRRSQKKHWIICLFTSAGYGRRVDRPEQIINHTYAALRDLREKLTDLRLDGTEPSPTALFSCQFNSGLFGVPWPDTRRVLDHSGLHVTVIYPPGDDEETA